MNMGAIHFICVLPPPITGMTTVSARMAEHIAATRPVNRLTLSRRPGLSDFHWRLAKHFGLIARAIEAIRVSRKGDAAYIAPDAGWGLLGTIALILLLRLKPLTIILHHHSFACLDRPTALSRTLFALTRNRALHIVLCNRMAKAMRAAYGNDLSIHLQSNDALVPAAPRRPQRKSLRSIGFLGNITLEKGIDTFLDLARTLATRHPELNIYIAGPSSPAARRLIDIFVSEDPGHRHYRGPVDDRAKAEFFETVDLLLFPSRYRNEAEPLVIHEAARAGTLVIATDLGCLPEQATFTFPPETFAARAADQISLWIEHPEAFQTAWQKNTAKATPPPLAPLPL